MNRKTKGYQMTMLGIVIGYFFFFSSNIWMPETGNFVKSSVGESLALGRDRRVTATRWDYSPEERQMEVEIEIENNSVDDVESYLFDVALKPAKQKIEIQKVLEEDNLVILQLDSIPKNFKEISLRMKANDDSQGEIVKMYNNKKEVNVVEKIEVKSKVEYQKDKLQRNIGTIEEDIEKIETEISESNKTIGLTEEKVSTLEEEKKYQTEIEIENTNVKIKQRKTEIENFRKEILGKEKQIRENRLKMQKIQHRIGEMK